MHCTVPTPLHQKCTSSANCSYFNYIIFIESNILRVIGHEIATTRSGTNLAYSEWVIIATTSSHYQDRARSIGASSENWFPRQPRSKSGSISQVIFLIFQWLAASFGRFFLLLFSFTSQLISCLACLLGFE